MRLIWQPVSNPCAEKALTVEEHRSPQPQYMDWIDARLKAGAAIEKMHAELREADLFHHWIDSADKMGG